ncbi:MAG: gamma-glutamyltransferase family protein [Candidatus Limnocylindrales bacterium]
MSRSDPDRIAAPALVPMRLVRGRTAAVVAPHHLATAAGLAVLRAGGSAVDAAIATNAALAVVMPNACGIGGDAFWLIWDARTRTQLALNGSGRAPAAASAAGLRALGLTTIPLRGPLSISVPGAVRSWGDAHAHFGRLPLAELLAPAIELADGGFPAWDGFVDAVERTTGIVDRALGPGAGASAGAGTGHGATGFHAGFHAMFRPHSRPWRLAERVRFPALATTLRSIAEDGVAAFYEGDLGDAQARFLAAAGAPFAAADLRDHTSTWADPIATSYRGVRVTTHPPNSQGITALQILNILETFEPPPAASFGAEGVAEAGWIHRGIEASKLAMADRDAEITDPAARAIPVDRLLDKGYARELAGRIDPRRASRPEPATNPRGGGTVYLATVDADGSAVSLIESNYGGFGSGVVDPATGIHYQNRGSYFSLDDAHPNVLAPGKRTLHTLMPGMLFGDDAGGDGGGPWIVTGAMGGDAQPQIHAQIVSALVDGGLDIGTAVAMPRWFVEPAVHFAPPVDVRAEPRFAPGILGELEALGHPIRPVEPFSGLLGHAHAIELVDGGPVAEGGSVAAATDPRSEGLPAVW